MFGFKQFQSAYTFSYIRFDADALSCVTYVDVLIDDDGALEIPISHRSKTLNPLLSQLLATVAVKLINYSIQPSIVIKFSIHTVTNSALKK